MENQTKPKRNGKRETIADRLARDSQLKEKVIWLFRVYSRLRLTTSISNCIYDLTCCCNSIDHNEIRRQVETHLKFHFSTDQHFCLRATCRGNKKCSIKSSIVSNALLVTIDVLIKVLLIRFPIWKTANFKRTFCIITGWDFMKNCGII